MKWQCPPLFLPGEFHGQRNLVGYSLWGHKELDMAEWLTHTHICYKVKVLVTQMCLTLCNPRDCSSSGFSVHGILQARILEWVAIPFSRGSSWPRDQTWISCIAGRFLTIWTSRKAQYDVTCMKNGSFGEENQEKCKEGPYLLDCSEETRLESVSWSGFMEMSKMSTWTLSIDRLYFSISHLHS